MVKDPLEQTKQYMLDHKIKEVFETLTAALLFHKPDDPEAFLLEKLSEIKGYGLAPLLSRTDLTAMFGMFDITNRGCVSAGQAKNALKTILGTEVQLDGQPLADSAQLTPHKFVTSMHNTLTSASPFSKPRRTLSTEE